MWKEQINKLVEFKYSLIVLSMLIVVKIVLLFLFLYIFVTLSIETVQIIIS